MMLPETSVTDRIPGDRGPDDARPAVAFANTLYALRGRVRDGLETPDQLAAWLDEHADALGTLPRGAHCSIAPAAVNPADLAAFVALRAAIRALMRAEIDALPPDADTIALLNTAASASPSWPALLRDGNRYEVVARSAGTALEHALGTLARDAVELLGGDFAHTLKACQGPRCIQFFVKDQPRREWCSSACGNRARVARHYARHRDDRAER